MKKVGVLVLCNRAPLIIDRVMDSLDSNLFRVFLHVDAKRDIGEYTRDMRNLARMTVVEPRTAVFWGGYTMVEAELTMIRAALKDPELEAFVMISDDTAPVRRAEIIHAALLATPNRISLEVRGDTQEWYKGFFMPDSQMTDYRNEQWTRKFLNREDVVRFHQLLEAHERGKKDIGLIYFSRQWWSLGRATLQALVDAMDNDEHMVESFKFSAIPDEIVFPTLFRIHHPNATTLGVPMFNWFNPQCQTFHTEAELGVVKISPEHLFMRKILHDRPFLVDSAANLGDTVAVAIQLLS